MKRNAMLIVLPLGLAATLAAQGPNASPNQVFERRVVISSPGPIPAGMDPLAIQYLGTEMSTRPLKGAPYSAKAVTETTQVLADGNRIHRNTSSAIYRDSEGRTRREHSLGAVGPLAPAGAMNMVFIMDPVAGVTYVLDPNEKVAHKSAVAKGFIINYRKGTTATYGTMAGPRDGDGAGAIFTRKLPEGAEGNTVMVQRHASGPMPPPDVLMAAPGVPANFNVPYKSEDLGTQVIEGVSATGTRTVMTIAAGEIGNERPIDVVSERWYSTELQAVVMTKNSDPRSGETVYRLTNISRTEPPRDLFEVPADYTVKDESESAAKLNEALRKARLKEEGK